MRRTTDVLLVVVGTTAYVLLGWAGVAIAVAAGVAGLWWAESHRSP